MRTDRTPHFDRISVNGGDGPLPNYFPAFPGAVRSFASQSITLKMRNSITALPFHGLRLKGAHSQLREYVQLSQEIERGMRAQYSLHRWIEIAWRQAEPATGLFPTTSGAGAGLIHFIPDLHRLSEIVIHRTMCGGLCRSAREYFLQHGVESLEEFLAVAVEARAVHCGQSLRPESRKLVQ